jgi:hypothetical protein
MKDLGLWRLPDNELVRVLRGFGGAALGLPVGWGEGADLCLSMVKRGVLEVVDDLELLDAFLRECLGRGVPEAAVVVNKDGGLWECE